MAGGKSWAQSVRREGRGKRRQEESREAWTVNIGLRGTQRIVAGNVGIRATVPASN